MREGHYWEPANEHVVLLTAVEDEADAVRLFERRSQTSCNLDAVAHGSSTADSSSLEKDSSKNEFFDRIDWNRAMTVVRVVQRTLAEANPNRAKPRVHLSLTPKATDLPHTYPGQNSPKIWVAKW